MPAYIRRLLIAAILPLVLLACPSFGQASNSKTPDVPRVEVRDGEIVLQGTVSRVNATARTVYLNVSDVYLSDGTHTTFSTPKGKVATIEAATQLQEAGSAIIPSVNNFNGELVIIVGKDTGVGKPLPARQIVGWPVGTGGNVNLVLVGTKAKITTGNKLSASLPPLTATTSEPPPPDTSTVPLADTQNWIINMIDKQAVVRDLNGEDVYLDENAAFDGTELDYTFTMPSSIVRMSDDYEVPLEKIDYGSITVDSSSIPPTDGSQYAQGLSVGNFYTVTAQTINKAKIVQNEQFMTDPPMTPIHGTLPSFVVFFSNQDTALSFAKALRHAVRLSQLVKQKPLF